LSIPKKLHAVWVGDESKCPHQWLQTWRDKHPTWEFKLWGNAEYDSVPWRSKRQMDIFRACGEWNAVADLMRYEILCEHGGVYVDADSMCVRAFDDWLLDTRMFAAWENEIHRPGLVGTSYIGSVPQHPVLRAIIRKTSRMNSGMWRRAWPNPFRWEEFPAWKTVGPLFFTNMVLPFCPKDATILPSVLFFPKHHLDKEERKSSLIYARHEWGTTHKSYAAPDTSLPGVHG
jgi:inositol phosphorylceramide mannosyltransferase catalytic subunit